MRAVKVMTDYSEQGAQPLDPEDARRPTVGEVEERQRREHPEQSRTAMLHLPEDAPVDGDNGGA